MAKVRGEDVRRGAEMKLGGRLWFWGGGIYGERGCVIGGRRERRQSFRNDTERVVADESEGGTLFEEC